MFENITEVEKIYISTYLNEIKEDIFNILKQYNIKYFHKDNLKHNMFFNKDDTPSLGIFYDSENNYISFNEHYYSNEVFIINFKKLKDINLWIYGDYYYYIVNQILNLENLPIEVRKD